MSLQAQADGVADRARRYVAQALEPVAAGGGAAWWPVATGLYDTFNKVRFEDRHTGWVLGRRSLVSTFDGGKTWTGQRFDGVSQFNDFDIMGQTVWIVGNEGVVFHTRVAGIPSRENVGTTDHLYGIDFIEDGVTGWIVGERGLLLVTRNGGGTWTPQHSGTNRNLIAVHAFDADTVWVGGSSISLHTTDGGTTWVTTSTDKTFYDALFLNETVGFAARGNKLYKTTNQGLTWLQRELSGRNIAVRGFSFVDDHTGWLANLYGQVFRTKDGGSSWSTLETGARRLNDVCFLDESTGWAVGDEGTLVNTAPLSLPVDGKTPDEVLSILQASIASPYFAREGILDRLEEFVDDYEAFLSALSRLGENEVSRRPTVPIPGDLTGSQSPAVGTNQEATDD